MATRSLPVTAIPLLLLAGAAVVFFLSPSEPAPSLSGKNGPPLTTTNPPSTNDAESGQDADNSLTANGSSSSSNPSTPSWVPMDLQKAEAIDRLPGWEVRRGNFKLIRDPANRHASLELFPEPIVEGKIRCARMMWGGGGIRARMQGEKSRRAFPRFSVGLHQDRELHLRAFPGEHRLELVACDPDLLNESLLTKADVPDWMPKPGDQTWLEFQIIPAPPAAPPADSLGPADQAPGTNGPAGNAATDPPPPPSICEGRVWIEGQARPEKAQLSHPLRLPPGVFFAAIQGAPFALKPIRIDAAETLTLNPPTSGTAASPIK